MVASGTRFMHTLLCRLAARTSGYGILFIATVATSLRKGGGEGHPAAKGRTQTDFFSSFCSSSLFMCTMFASATNQQPTTSQHPHCSGRYYVCGCCCCCSSWIMIIMSSRLFVHLIDACPDNLFLRWKSAAVADVRTLPVHTHPPHTSTTHHSTRRIIVQILIVYERQDNNKNK